jgi:hypothetical protein
VPSGRRILTRNELQSLFDAEYAKGTKRWLPALRDSTAAQDRLRLRTATPFRQLAAQPQHLHVNSG